MIQKTPSTLKRVIVDYKKLTPQILNTLVKTYPDGYDDRDVITFRNHYNEAIEAVELRTKECIYLVKVSTKLVAQMEMYDVQNADFKAAMPDIKEIG